VGQTCSRVRAGRSGRGNWRRRVWWRAWIYRAQAHRRRPEQTQTKAEDTAQAAPKPQEQTATAPQIAPQIAPEARTIIRDLMGSVPDLTPEVQQKIADTIATKIPSALDTPTATHKFIDTLAQTTDMPKERVVADFFVRSMYQTPEADAYRTTLNNLFKDVNDFKLPTITAQDFITSKAADVVQESHDAVSRRISSVGTTE